MTLLQSLLGSLGSPSKNFDNMLRVNEKHVEINENVVLARTRTQFRAISCIGYPFRKFPKRVLACAFCRIPALARVTNLFHTSKPSLTFTVALGQVFNDLAVEQLPAMNNQKHQCWMATDTKSK